MRVNELGTGSGPQQQLASALADGLGALDLAQTVEFQLYTRVVLPIDGYVFWQPFDTQRVAGALHITQEVDQSEDETYGAATITFTTTEPVVQFVNQPIDQLWVGSFAGVRFAFPQQQGFFSQASLWHYFGTAISPILARQLLDQDGVVDPTRAIVSNSLPAWLALNSYVSPFLAPGTQNAKFLLYPAKLVPPNLPPPYGTVNIGVSDTEALQSFPIIDPYTGSSYQLLADRVRIRLFGLQANEGVDFFNRVLIFGGPNGPDSIGIMDMAWVADDNSRDSAALQAVAMVKTIELRVSYYQTRILAVAEKLITAASATYIAQQLNGSYQTIQTAS
jgi:hypothetical protein